MPNLKLKILYFETQESTTFGIKDVSTYEIGIINNPILKVCVPGFGEKEIVFIPNSLNLIDSTKLGITELGCEQDLPDGFYKFTYCTTLATLPTSLKTCVYNNFFRTNKIQELFDNAFLKLELSECNSVLKKQELINLNTINIFIQSAIASANNCSEKQALVLYTKAKRMLEKFTTSECSCN